MRIYDRCIEALTSRGMFPEQAKEVMEKVKLNHPEMRGRWEENERDYPEGLINIIWMGVKSEAFEYIKENCPQAWFRPMFEYSDEQLTEMMKNKDT